MKDDEAASELVAALLLTAIITVGIAIVAFNVLSNASSSPSSPELYTGREIPALNVDLVDTGSNYITLIHDGGNPVYRQTTRIMVDGVDRTDDFKTPDGSDWTTFSVGDLLISDIPKEEGTRIQLIFTASENPTVLDNLITGPTPPVPPPPVASFTAVPTTGYAPLPVSFEDTSSGSPFTWYWKFGDNTPSQIIEDPVHTYSSSGTYEVNLTVCNDGGCDSAIKHISVFGFSDYVVNESVFVYGNQMSYSGDDVTGSGSTIIITGDLETSDLNGGSSINVTNIYIDGDVYLDGGSADLGSTTDPGIIVVNGSMTLWSGGRDIYGDVYVNGDFALKDAHIHGDVYVNGDLTLGWTPSFDSGSNIYYTGSFTYPPSMYSWILARCIHQTTVPTEEMPAMEIPDAKSSVWYTSRGYVSGGSLVDNKKIYASSYSTTANWYDSAENIIIVAYGGDITLNNFWGIPVTGVLFAPNGKVTFTGSSFEGVVIAKDGFYVNSGGTDVVFKNISEYITNPSDYPF